MKVYYDYQILTDQKYGGISRYFFELSSRLEPLGIDTRIGCVRSINYYFRERFRMHGKINNRFIGKFFGALNQINALLGMRKCDIIHPTYYRYYMLGKYSGKLVVTVYDMIHEKFVGDKTTINRKNKLIHAADHIIAISESTKKDVLELYPDISPEKISVIYLGNSMPELQEAGANPIGRKYVLFVGLRKWYKNFTRFAEAMIPILESHPELCVLCTGGGEFAGGELGAAEKLSSRFIQANLNDDDLRQAYANAECFVFPSQYEGFGIPVLESFACNCPLVCSNSSSLPEVAGDAAEYFDPLNTEEMSAKILKVIEDKDLREKLRSSGRERLKLFSWDKSAQEHLECYRHVLES